MSFRSAWNAKFKDLPTLQVRPVMTDDDVDFHSDITYMRSLLDAIVMQASEGGHCGPWPGDLTAHFAWLEKEVSDG